MDKYYTPTKEEFHIGFKYEYVAHSMVYLEEAIWDGKGEGLDFLFKHNAIQVKYLDREDIESLGFELFDTTKKDEIYFRSTDNLMTEQEVRLWVSKAFGYIEINDIKEKTGCEGSFRGTIKNKSELKKVLKQIGYEGK